MQWGILILGGIVAPISVVVWLLNRAKYKTPKQPSIEGISGGLLRREIDQRLPDHATPGMIGILDDGRISTQDLLITFVDLAARGYLTITPPPNSGSQWLLTRTEKPATDLRDFEATLIGRPFAETNSCTLESLVSDDEGLQAATAQLQRDTDAEGWFKNTIESHWGKIGGGLVLLGLALLATGIIIGLSTLPIAGAGGGALVAASGMLLASLAKMQRDHSESGRAARNHLARYREWLTTLDAHHLLPEIVSAIFNENVAAALAFGDGDHFARIFAVAHTRASKWGTADNLVVDFGWMLEADTPTVAVHHAMHFVEDGMTLARRYHLP